MASIALVMVAFGVITTATARLAAHESASSGARELWVAAASVVVLPIFAVVKYRIAAAVPSAALRMDGNITLVGAAMALVTLAGLAATSSFGWSSADPIAAIFIGVAAATVGFRGLRA